MYLALYRKYRPQTFADVISQEHITTTLTNQLKNGQVAHAYLFTGSRGTGKTTCAKILAKAVNCTSPENGNPCLKCDICRLVDEGVSDVLEIDAASNNGVDAVRALRDEAMYSPVSCKYRVYIIDEVHMLSTAAFNALLKLIEEPPSHVIFILATTEIHKVPATIISRCQRFEFRRIDIRDSAERLRDICMTEGAELDENAAYLIARLSDGGMRDALSLLDQCISVSKRVNSDTVRECAGVAGSDHLFEIADCVASQNTAQALDRLNTLVQSGKDVTRLTEELIQHYRNLMLLKINSGTEKLVCALPDETERYMRQNKAYSLEMIMRSITILGDCLERLSRSKQRGVTAEMCMIKLCTPRLDTDTAALSMRIDRLERELAAVRAGDAPRSGEAERIVSQAAQSVQPTAASENTAPPIPETAEAIPTDSPASITEAEEAFAAASPEIDEGIPPPSEPQYDGVISESEETTAKTEKPKTDIPPQTGGGPSKSGEVREWADIVDSLPFSICVLIGGTTARYNGDEIIVEGTSVAKSFVSGEYNAPIREAAEKALGRRYAIVAAPDETEIQQDKVSELLTRAEKQGITIKKK